MKYTLNTIYIIVGIILMTITNLFSGVIPSELEYLDEFFCVLNFFLLLFYVVRGKTIFKYYILFVLTVGVGLLGNLLYTVQTDFRLAVLDAFIFSKPYLLLMYTITSVNEEQANLIYKFFVKFFKFLLIILAVCSLLTVLFDMNIINSSIIGMQSRNGVFIFFSGFGGTVSNLTILFFSVIACSSKNKRWIFFLLSTIIILRADSGLGKLSLVGFILVYFFLEKQKKFRWYYLLFIIPICLWVGRNEITGYLLDSEAPRYKLLFYSFVTAWTYFPIGSGFATYGSTTAMTHYSSLYYRYNFHTAWGMRENEAYFLMDSYYPQIIGQTGAIGSILYTFFMLKLFRRMVWEINSINIKSAAVFLFGSWFVAGLGFGTSSLWGCLVFMFLSIFYLNGKYRLCENCE